jgi:hypothetical protein
MLGGPLSFLEVQMGTWSTYYEQGVKAEPNTPTGWAILAIKAELVFNGIPRYGMEMDSPEVGTGTVRAIRQFQHSIPGLAADGSVGPYTAHALFKKRILQVEKTLGVEPGLLCKVKSLESSDDPACLSADLHDRGPMQINSVSHPQVTDEQCYHPPFCFMWSGKYLRAAYEGVLTVAGKKDWTLALASYNVGWGGARKWDRDGRPSGTLAYGYVKMVRGRIC